MSGDERELKDQRVVTMMSPSELEAIDNWMFQSRIRSRGEAIRRLCQVGLLISERGPEITKVLSEAATTLREIDYDQIKIPAGTSYAEAVQRLIPVIGEMSVFMASAMKLFSELHRLQQALHVASDELDTGQFLKNMEHLRELIRAISENDGGMK